MVVPIVPVVVTTIVVVAVGSVVLAAVVLMVLTLGVTVGTTVLTVVPGLVTTTVVPVAMVDTDGTDTVVRGGAVVAGETVVVFVGRIVVISSEIAPNFHSEYFFRRWAVRLNVITLKLKTLNVTIGVKAYAHKCRPHCVPRSVSVHYCRARFQKHGSMNPAIRGME